MFSAISAQAGKSYFSEFREVFAEFGLVAYCGWRSLVWVGPFVGFYAKLVGISALFRRNFCAFLVGFFTTFLQRIVAVFCCWC